MKKALILLAFLTLVACSNKQVMLGKKCLKEVNGNEDVQAKIGKTPVGKVLNSLTQSK